MWELGSSDNGTQCFMNLVMTHSNSRRACLYVCLGAKQRLKRSARQIAPLTRASRFAALGSLIVLSRSAAAPAAPLLPQPRGWAHVDTLYRYLHPGAGACNHTGG